MTETHFGPLTRGADLSVAALSKVLSGATVKHEKTTRGEDGSIVESFKVSYGGQLAFVVSPGEKGSFSVEVHTAKLRTAEGVAVGSSFEELRDRVGRLSCWSGVEERAGTVACDPEHLSPFSFLLEVPRAPHGEMILPSKYGLLRGTRIARLVWAPSSPPEPWKLALKKDALGPFKRGEQIRRGMKAVDGTGAALNIKETRAWLDGELVRAFAVERGDERGLTVFPDSLFVERACKDTRVQLLQIHTPGIPVEGGVTVGATAETVEARLGPLSCFARPGEYGLEAACRAARWPQARFVFHLREAERPASPERAISVAALKGRRLSSIFLVPGPADGDAGAVSTSAGSAGTAAPATGRCAIPACDVPDATARAFSEQSFALLETDPSRASCLARAAIRKAEAARDSKTLGAAYYNLGRAQASLYCGGAALQSLRRSLCLRPLPLAGQKAHHAVLKACRGVGGVFDCSVPCEPGEAAVDDWDELALDVLDPDRYVLKDSIKPGTVISAADLKALCTTHVKDPAETQEGQTKVLSLAKGEVTVASCEGHDGRIGLIIAGPDKGGHRVLFRYQGGGNSGGRIKTSFGLGTDLAPDKSWGEVTFTLTDCNNPDDGNDCESDSYTLRLNGVQVWLRASKHEADEGRCG